MLGERQNDAATLRRAVIIFVLLLKLWRGGERGRECRLTANGTVPLLSSTIDGYGNNTSPPALAYVSSKTTESIEWISRRFLGGFSAGFWRNMGMYVIRF